METKKKKILVAIRKRPLTSSESKNSSDIVEVIHPNGLFLSEQRKKLDLTKYIEEHAFKFDAVFDETQSNLEIYTKLIKPLVNYAFTKKKVSCFAYGQTGSGKTFTMMGDSKNNKGLYLLAAEDIFKILDKEEHELRVGISFYEIYCGKAYDLLNERESCPIRVDKRENVKIIGLSEKFISNSDSLMSLIDIGLEERITGKTGMNSASSRSHAVLAITLRKIENHKLFGKMSFIDLAGSERGADVKDTDKQTRIDGAEINKSLLALKECIRALDMEKKHLPFRGSKLTLVLKDSFIGKSCAVMIGNISPALESCEHTLNTLRYADRVKELGGGKKKGKSLADELMLARSKNNTTRKRIVKDKEDSHLVFEEYDVGKHLKKNTSVKSEKTFEKTKKNIKPSRFNFQKKNFVKKIFGDQNQKNKDDDDNTNSEKSQKSKNNFLKYSNSKSPIKYKNSSSNNLFKKNEKIKTNFLLKKPKNKSPLKKKMKINFENFKEVKEELIKKYSNYIDEVVGIAKSDMRNIEILKKNGNFENGFNKVRSNLDKKIRAVNKFKKEICRVDGIIKENEEKNKRISLSEDPFLLNGELDGGDNDDLLFF